MAKKNRNKPNKTRIRDVVLEDLSAFSTGVGATADKINPRHYKRVMRDSSTFNAGFERIKSSDGEETETFVRCRARPFEVVDIIDTFAGDNGHLAHVLTYLLRAGEKVEPGESVTDATVRDLKKARWWIGRRIEFLTGEPNPDNR